MQPGPTPSETTQDPQPPSTQLEEREDTEDAEDEVSLDEEDDEEADFGEAGGDAHAAAFGSPALALSTTFCLGFAFFALAFPSWSDVQPAGNCADSILASSGMSSNFGLYL